MLVLLVMLRVLVVIMKILQYNRPHIKIVSRRLRIIHYTKKFFIKDFFCKCDQNRWKLRIWSHLLKNSLWKTSFFVQ